MPITQSVPQAVQTHFFCGIGRPLATWNAGRGGIGRSSSTFSCSSEAAGDHHVFSCVVGGQANTRQILILAVLLSSLNKRFERVFPRLIQSAPYAQDVTSVTGGYI